MNIVEPLLNDFELAILNEILKGANIKMDDDFYNICMVHLENIEDYESMVIMRDNKEKLTIK